MWQGWWLDNSASEAGCEVGGSPQGGYPVQAPTLHAHALEAEAGSRGEVEQLRVATKVQHWGRVWGGREGGSRSQSGLQAGLDAIHRGADEQRQCCMHTAG